MGCGSCKKSNAVQPTPCEEYLRKRQSKTDLLMKGSTEVDTTGIKSIE